MSGVESRASRIALVGFMGAGKSMVGRLLAERLGWTLVDTDAEVVRETGLSIREIFHEKGESGFRSMERRAIERALRVDRAVLALGGGALEDPATRAGVQARCAVVFLAARPETLERRLGEAPGERPLLAGGFPAGRLAARHAAYAAAHLTVETDTVSADAVAERIAAWWREARGAPERRGR